MRDAVEGDQVGLEGLKAARFQLLKVFGRIERFGDQIDEAFGGEMFLQDIAPDAPANRRRVKAFLEEHIQVTKLLGYAIELWLLTCGMKPEDDWVPLLIEDMRLRAQRGDDGHKSNGVTD